MLKIDNFFKKTIPRKNENSEKKNIKLLHDLFITKENKNSGLFDVDWYEIQYPDVIASGQSAFYHYINHGCKEGRNPGPFFDTHFYLTKYPDVMDSGLNPLYHYLMHGRAEGRQCNPFTAFDR